MNPRTLVLVVAIAASAAMAWYFASAPAPGDAVVLRSPPAATPAATPTTAEPATATPRAPLPPAGAPFASAQGALNERALAGDGAAAWRWYRDDADCRRWQEWSAAPEGFARKLIDGVAAADRYPPFFAMPPEEFEAFRNPANTAEVAAANAQNLMERLESLCTGAALANDDTRYRIALAAAQSGPKAAAWQFVDAPPADLATNDARQRDWSANAVKIVEGRLGKGDVEAAFALGVGYAKDAYDEGSRGAPQRNAFYGALENDPRKAYELLTLYLSTQPEPRRQERTQALLAELGATLTDAERADAQKAAEAARIKLLTPRED
jgi:hypothetical protein